MPKRILVLAVACALSWPFSAAPLPWTEIQTGHFTVITNAGEKEGRRTAWQFEQIRAALVQLWPWARIDSGKPIVVFAAKDEATLRTLGPQYWEGKRFRPVSFSSEGRGKLFLALRTDVAPPDNVSANPYQSAYWSYVSAVFTRSFPESLPSWYSRGIAEVMSNTFVREKELHVGRLMENNLALVRQHAPIPLSEFLAADRRSHWLTQEDDISLFDAQSWAFVHFLMFGEERAHAAKTSRFNQLLLAGTPPERAVKEAFGDLAPLYEGMLYYTKRDLFSYVKVPVSLDLKETAFAARPLSVAESAVARAEMLVAAGRSKEASALAAEAAAANPELAGPFEIEAALADAEGRRDDARAAYEKAVAKGSGNAHAHYRLAQLLYAPNAGKETLERQASLLEKARQLDPQRANALSFLAEILCDLGRAGEAVSLAKSAVDAEPSVSYHRRAYARALWYVGQHDEAIRFSREALAVAGSEDDRKQLQAFLDFAERNARPQTRPAQVEASPVPAPAASSSSVRVASAFRADDYGEAARFVPSCVLRRDDQACAAGAPAFEAACEKGFADACRTLGSLQDGGFGIRMDKSRAAASYTKGCLAGDKASCARFAVLQAQGQGVAPDPVAAVAKLQSLCAEQVDDACVGWALLLVARSAKADIDKARSLLTASCGRDNEEACRLLKSFPR